MVTKKLVSIEIAPLLRPLKHMTHKDSMEWLKSVGQNWRFPTTAELEYLDSITGPNSEHILPAITETGHNLKFWIDDSYFVYDINNSMRVFYEEDDVRRRAYPIAVRNISRIASPPRNDSKQTAGIY